MREARYMLVRSLGCVMDRPASASVDANIQNSIFLYCSLQLPVGVCREGTVVTGA